MLAVRDIDVFYGPVQALRHVSLEINKGEIVTVLGANGAGKSTLLRTISGLIQVKGEGEILLDGKHIHNHKPENIVRMGVAHVPEGRRVFPRSSTWENLLVGAFSRSDMDQIRLDAEEQLDLFPQLRERRDQMAKVLSGGEQQMLAICRGLMARPRLLLLDEPSLGLAPILVQEIFQKIEQLRSRGVSILLVEQNAAQALSIADRGYVLVTGEVAIQGSGKELMESDRVRQLYLGGT